MNPDHSKPCEPLAYARPGTVRTPLNLAAVVSVPLALAAIIALHVAYDVFEDRRFTPVAVILGFAALLTGIIAIYVGRDRGPSTLPRRRLTGFGILGALLSLAPLVAATVLPPARSRCGSKRMACESHLREIGQAAYLFANDHGGRMPDGVDELLTQDIVPAVFVCPSTLDTPAAAAPTTQATAANVRARGHCSYVYLGKGWRAENEKADVILAYEPLSNHGGVGMNVLYGDAHVEWVNASVARGMLAELAIGHNPPRTGVSHESMPSSQPALSQSDR